MTTATIGLLYGVTTLIVMFTGMPIAFALGAVATPTELDARASGFGLSCQNIHLANSGSALQIAATCTNEGGGNNGVQVFTLSECLGNNNGEMQCQEKSVFFVCAGGG